MTAINNQTYTELGHLSQRIESNIATISDYHRYEQLLLSAGLPKTTIFSFLGKANLQSWEELVIARKKEENLHRENLKAIAVGGLIGLALALFIFYIIEDK